MPTQNTLLDLLSPDAITLLRASGKDLVKRIGLEAIREVLLEILSGRNLRTATEILTRRRIELLNMATLHLFLKGTAQDPHFIAQLPHLATELLKKPRISREERWLAQWLLGLTDKGVQNILRDDYLALDHYVNSYISTSQAVVSRFENDFGALAGQLRLENLQINISWLLMLYLMNTIGAQTLTLRGSDKSTYGKLFEKLVLGTLLSILGFRYDPIGQDMSQAGVFWLSSAEDKRESDATLLYSPGRGVRFDIGFIGRGNSEISLDKVSRYRRKIELGRTNWYMETIIIVDQIGASSRIEALAQEVNGKIVQMSASYWVQQVASILHEVFGFEHPILQLQSDELADYLKQAVDAISLVDFLPPNAD
jgi:hypothetical protein